MLSQLGEGAEGGEGEEGEEGIVKMMEGMMSTLLSRDVLHPSLTEICKQVFKKYYVSQQYYRCIHIVMYIVLYVLYNVPPRLPWCL